MSRLAEAAQRARDWMIGSALPLWAGAGMGHGGAFQERMNFDGSPDLGVPRRMRVQARQLYVYSEAATRGWWPRATADAGFEALVRDYWAADGKPGFIHTVNQDGTPRDLKRDAYDHAFGLFALAWYFKASGDGRALELAHKILDVMESQLADPVNGGFVESIPAALPRRSDPHMHLLESMLEWTDATGEARFLGVAKDMVALFERRFFFDDTGTLGEYFTATLEPAEGAPGQVVAPGHHMEWCWLLDWAKALGAGDATAKGRRLYDYAARHGLDALGLAIDECDRQGRQVRRSRRAWPQTELIKGHLTMARAGLPGAADAAAEVAILFLDSYLATEIPGLWMDQFDEAGRGMTETAPASTLYHVVVAFRELMLFAQDNP
jgi:mannose-6-phosphate isomerase